MFFIDNYQNGNSRFNSMTAPMVRLPSVGILNKFMLDFQYLFLPICTAVLNKLIIFNLLWEIIPELKERKQKKHNSHII